MNKLSRDNYSGSITKNEIDEFISNSSNFSVGVKKIQNLKEDIVNKIFSTLKIDTDLFKVSEESYYELLSSNNGYISKSFIGAVEKMTKEQTQDSLRSKAGYIGDFNNFINTLNNYVGYSKTYLESLLSDDLVNPKEKLDIRSFLTVFDHKHVENTRSRRLSFSEDIFNSNLQNGVSHKNIECFYEEDYKGNKNYFSFNTILNYIDTFGVEMGLPEIKLDSENSDIMKKYFPSINRRLKHSMYNNILQTLRDKQEILMYGFKDYELINGYRNDNKNGFIAEKIVELEFRELANLSDFNISISRSSIGEDQQNKIDLYIILEDKKTGIKIKDELQITLKNDLKLKRMQVNKRNRILRKSGNYTESQLINFTMKDLSKKMYAWKYFNRPIGKLSGTLDHSEKEIIRKTFRRLIREMERKKALIQAN